MEWSKKTERLPGEGDDGEWALSLHQLFLLPPGHSGSHDAASYIYTVAPHVLQSKHTDLGATGGERGDSAGNSCRFGGLKEFIT